MSSDIPQVLQDLDDIVNRLYIWRVSLTQEMDTRQNDIFLDVILDIIHVQEVLNQIALQHLEKDSHDQADETV